MPTSATTRISRADVLASTAQTTTRRGAGGRRAWRPFAGHAPASVLNALAHAGRPGRELAVRLDLLRAAGPRHSLQRLRDDVRRRRGGDAGLSVYAEIWSEAAAAAGAELEHLGHGFWRIRRAGAETTVWKHVVMLDDAVTLRLALNKPIVDGLLAEAGVPVPDQVEVSAGEPGALEFVRAADGACVVKPARGSSGSGATTGVRTPAELRRASIRAARVDDRIVVQSQAEGDLYRVLLLEGRPLDVLRRLPPRVTGDGRSTIAALIDRENARRLDAGGSAGSSLLLIDLECVLTLGRDGLSLDSVLAEGQTVAVKGVTNQNSIDDNSSVRDEVGQSLLEDAARAARATGIRLAGVDLITPDPRRSLADAGGVVIEVNATPGLHYHYQIADADRAQHVAVPILERLLAP